MNELIVHNHGSVLIIDHIAHMLLVEILRAHLASAEDFPWVGCADWPIQRSRLFSILCTGIRVTDGP